MPSLETIEKALEQIQKRPSNHEYFFSKLSSPDWIQPLDERHFFSKPPAAIRRGDSISFPFWPESQYLAKMAPKAPELVASIIMKIPLNDNIRIHTDLAEAAARLPPQLAAKWAKKEIEWLQTQDHLYFLLPEALGKLASYLAKSDEKATSLDIIRWLLKVELTGEDQKQVRSILDTWDYEQILQNIIPEVAKILKIDALSLLCELLANSIAGSGEKNEDFSWIWRPAIEPHVQNHRYGDIRDHLVDAVRDTSILLADLGEDIDAIMKTLLDNDRLIFKRISLHLLSEKESELFSRAKDITLNKENFLEVRIRHEYFSLLSKIFPRLSNEEKDLVLGWIDQGPPTADKEYDQDTATKRIEFWQAEHLKPIYSNLPENWQKRYLAIIERVGEPEHPDFLSYTASWVGPLTPKEEHEISSMEIEEIVKFLRTWRPQQSSGIGPEPEGLARTLQSVVSKSPDRFLETLEFFKEVKPRYVGAVIDGLNEALKNKQLSAGVEKSLDYLLWLVNSLQETSVIPGRRLDRDETRSWARQSSARFIRTIIEKGSLKVENRFTLWRIIKILAEDPNPTVEDDSNSAMDPATLSINTIRGEALHCAIQYALWVKKVLKKGVETIEEQSFSIKDIPEVQEVLERHLDPSIESSPAIRSVYGQWLPWLSSLDPIWCKGLLSKIFSKDHPRLRNAAWFTYLSYCPVYNEVFDLLREEYSAYIEHLRDPVDEFRGSLRKPSECFGEHLMVLIGRGILEWKRGEIVANFFNESRPSDAAHAVAYTGRILQNQSKEIPKEVVLRFHKFWIELTEFVKIAKDHRAEILKPFGWWFASGRFETEWAFDQVDFVISKASDIEPDRLVVEELENLSATHLERSLSVVKSLIQRDKEGWRILGSKDITRKILTEALGKPSTRIEGENIVHLLGAKGFFEFRDLLQRSQ